MSRGDVARLERRRSCPEFRDVAYRDAAVLTYEEASTMSRDTMMQHPVGGVVYRRILTWTGRDWPPPPSADVDRDLVPPYWPPVGRRIRRPWVNVATVTTDRPTRTPPTGPRRCGRRNASDTGRTRSPTPNRRYDPDQSHFSWSEGICFHVLEERPTAGEPSADPGPDETRRRSRTPTTEPMEYLMWI